MGNRVIPDKHHGAFGNDAFGRACERFALFFGTPKYLLGQSIIVALWIAWNTGLALFLLHNNGAVFDKSPYIMLNLVFSTQAAYSAPMILLAQKRQADRDKILAEHDEQHREEIAQMHREQLDENTDLTRQIHAETQMLDEIHRKLDAMEKRL